MESNERGKRKRLQSKPGDDRRKSYTGSGDQKRKSGKSFDKKPFDSAKPGERSNRWKQQSKPDDDRRKSYSDSGGYKKKFEGRRSHDSFKDTDKPRSRSFSKEKSDSTRRNKPEKTFGERPHKPGFEKSTSYKKKFTDKKGGAGKDFKPRKRHEEDTDTIRLNRFIANAGICSRREADVLITSGAIKVNGVIVTELGTKIRPGVDIVHYGDQALTGEHKIYVLLNKPKGFITTTDDPDKRKTVMDLVSKACRERIYPVGRLDRNTTGLLLFTNDGEMAKKLTHPSHKIRKIYHIMLDRPLAKTDFIKISQGITLDDGFVKPDEISYIGDGSNKREIGMEIHSGQNRVVRRIFEKLEYEVIKLDRVYLAGLTKKDINRGRWRYLTDLEIAMLKMI